MINALWSLLCLHKLLSGKLKVMWPTFAVQTTSVTVTIVEIGKSATVADFSQYLMIFSMRRSSLGPKTVTVAIVTVTSAV